MGLLKLKPKKPNNFDPVVEAQLIIDKICNKTKVERAYLFGSGVSGRFTVESDLDLLLVFSNAADLSKAKVLVYAKPLSAWPVDYILKLESDFDKRKDIGGVCFEAYHHGKLLTV